MIHTRRHLLAAATAALAIAIWLAPQSVQAFHPWEPYHWFRTSNPLVLRVGDNVSDTWDSYLTEALSDWDLGASTISVPSQLDVLTLTAVPGGTRPRTCKPIGGTIQVCSESYGFNGWLGLARIWADGNGHISQATTQMNDSYFDTAYYDTEAWRQMVVCQEVGHDFGLDHQDEVFDNANLGTCMDYTDDPSTNQDPNTHDFEELAAIYSHVDTAPSGGGGKPGNGRNGGAPSFGPDAPGQDEDFTPGEWGMLIRSDGRTAVFELDLGAGNKIVTHVIWAQ